MRFSQFIGVGVGSQDCSQSFPPKNLGEAGQPTLMVLDQRPETDKPTMWRGMLWLKPCVFSFLQHAGAEGHELSPS